MKRTQQGMTIIEAMGALAIASMLLVGVSTLISASLDDAKGQQSALYQEQVAAAAGKYIAANRAALGTGATATITIAQLKAGGFLSDSFAATNSYRQSTCVLVRPAAAGRLDALVASYGGTPIPERDLPQVAMQAGQGGGYISSAAPGSARGASWDLLTTPWRGVACGGAGVAVLPGSDGGHLVTQLFSDGPAQLASDFLARDAVPGQDAANRMMVPVQLVAGSGAQAIEGDATDARCTAAGSNGKLATDGTGAVLSCQDGVWKRQGSRYWRDAVAGYADLPASGNQPGEVRMVTGLGRAFTWTGAAWAALAADQDGNLLVPDTLTTNQLKLNRTVTANQPCSDNGTMARDASGLMLSCQSGVWRNPLTFRLGGQVYNQEWTVHVNDGTEVDTWIDLSTFPGPRPLYITGYAFCHATGFPRAYAYVTMVNPNGPGFMVGGCMSRPDSTGNGVLNTGKFGLQEIPENVTMLQLHREVEPDAHCATTCLAGPTDYIQLAIKIYNSE